MSTIQRIRQKILDKDYYISWHAEEEMMDDNLERPDIVNAILQEMIEHKLTHAMLHRGFASRCGAEDEKRFSRYF